MISNRYVIYIAALEITPCILMEDLTKMAEFSVDERIMREKEKNPSFGQVRLAKAVGVSRNVVRRVLKEQAARVEIAEKAPPPPPPKKVDGAVTRVCLRCDRPFESKWLGNRLCPNCSTNAARGIAA
jgi:ribosome-binding protein aMBF1 (putative translation factor)